jgi:hypothetical protein
MSEAAIEQLEAVCAGVDTALSPREQTSWWFDRAGPHLVARAYMEAVDEGRDGDVLAYLDDLVHHVPLAALEVMVALAEIGAPQHHAAAYHGPIDDLVGGRGRDVIASLEVAIRRSPAVRELFEGTDQVWAVAPEVAARLRAATSG